MSAVPALPDPDEDGMIRTTATIAGATYRAKIDTKNRIVTIATGPAIADQLADLVNRYHPIVAERYPDITLTPAHAAMFVGTTLMAMSELATARIDTSGVSLRDDTDLDYLVGQVEQVLDPSWVCDQIATAYDQHRDNQ